MLVMVVRRLLFSKAAPGPATSPGPTIPVNRQTEACAVYWLEDPA